MNFRRNQFLFFVFLKIVEKSLTITTYEDLWGYQIQWYDKEDGWNENKRQKFRENQQYSLTQSQKMPAYTKFGYQKMKIPKQLYDLIYDARYKAKMSIENCEMEYHNCQRIKSDGTLGKYKKNSTRNEKFKTNILFSLISAICVLIHRYLCCTLKFDLKSCFAYFFTRFTKRFLSRKKDLKSSFHQNISVKNSL